MQGQEIGVSGDYGCGLGGESEFEVDVVVGITAVLDRFGWGNPLGCGSQELQDLVTAVWRQYAGELWAGEDGGDFREDGLGEGDGAVRSGCGDGFSGTPFGVRAADMTVLASMT